MTTTSEKIKQKTVEALDLISNWYKSNNEKPLEFNAKLEIINAELKSLKNQKKLEEMAIEASQADSLMNDFIKGIKSAGHSIDEVFKKLSPNKGEKVFYLGLDFAKGVDKSIVTVNSFRNSKSVSVPYQETFEFTVNATFKGDKLPHIEITEALCKLGVSNVKFSINQYR